MHLTEEILAPVRERYGEPVLLEWEGEISAEEHALATFDPRRRHDVTLFVLGARRLALIRKHAFPLDVWRTPGGGIRRGEGFVAGALREALEETGLRVRLERYLVDVHARFLYGPTPLDWRTHVVLATTRDEVLRPRDVTEIADARWGTLEELAGPLRARLLASGRAFWRYRVALHDAALAALAK